jgi:hypothetical protein
VQVETSAGQRAPATTSPPGPTATLPPDSQSYRLKRKLLGKPLLNPAYELRL